MEVRYDIYLVDKEGHKIPSRMDANQDQRDRWLKLLDESEDPNQLVNYLISKRIKK